MSNRLICSLNMSGKHMGKAPMLMGFAFYLQIIYYFGFTRLEQMGFGKMLLMLILPALLTLAFIVLMRGIHYKNPVVYGAIGMAYCLLLLLQSLTSGSVLRIVLACIVYVACMVMMCMVVLKLLNKWFAVGALLAAAGGRFFIFDLVQHVFKLHFVAMILEASVICALLSLAIMFYYLEIKAAIRR